MQHELCCVSSRLILRRSLILTGEAQRVFEALGWYTARRYLLTAVRAGFVYAELYYIGVSGLTWNLDTSNGFVCVVRSFGAPHWTLKAVMIERWCHVVSFACVIAVDGRLTVAPFYDNWCMPALLTSQWWMAYVRGLCLPYIASLLFLNTAPGWGAFRCNPAVARHSIADLDFIKRPDLVDGVLFRRAVEL